MVSKRSNTNRPNLVNQVGAALRNLIVSGELQVGDRLPSEAALTKQHSVSRTVIREALAVLRADGLVAARQGSGVYVIEPEATTPSGFGAISHERISSVIEVLELRSAVETEAAALAAIRHSPAQEEELFKCHRLFEACITDGTPTTEADFKLHLAIADASNNPRFREFMQLMGANGIPRLLLRAHEQDASRSPTEYLEKIHSEHQHIIDAISARDEEGARLAMRTHLKGAEQRYRNLLRQNPDKLYDK